jgi:hemerythrin-like metal-binding protein
MDLIIWRESFETGYLRVDNQHKQLVILINKLYKGMGAKDKEEQLKLIFNELFNYTLTHFAMEETMMQGFEYANYLQHKDQHSQFIIKMKDFKEAYLLGNKKINLEILNFLKDWLLKHIVGTDKVTFEEIKKRIQ